MAYQHGLENVFDRQCLSLELLGYLATSPEPGLPMPPRFFLETEQSSMFGDVGADCDKFVELVANAPHCIISDSILGLTNVDDPTRHQFRSCYDTLYDHGVCNHMVK